MNPQWAFVLSCWGLLISENNPPTHLGKLCEKDALAGVLDTGLFTRDSRWLLQWCFLWVTRCSETWWGFKKKKKIYGVEVKRFSTECFWGDEFFHSHHISSFLFEQDAEVIFWNFIYLFILIFRATRAGGPLLLNSWKAAHLLWCIFNQKPVTVPVMKHYRSLTWESRLIILHLGYETSACL